MPHSTIPRDSDHDLARRVAQVNPAWRLKREQGVLTLRGDGMPALFYRAIDCAAWLDRRQVPTEDTDAAADRR